MYFKRFVLFLLLLSGILTLTACGAVEDTPGEASSAVISLEPEPIPEPEPEPEIRPDYILYPAFSEQVFFKDHYLFTMTNDKANSVDFRFELRDNSGTVLYTSERVKPGDSVQWDTRERWKDGRHRLVIVSTPIDADGTEGNALTQGIAVTVQ